MNQKTRDEKFVSVQFTMWSHVGVGGSAGEEGGPAEASPHHHPHHPALHHAAPPPPHPHPHNDWRWDPQHRAYSQVIPSCVLLPLKRNAMSPTYLSAAAAAPACHRALPPSSSHPHSIYPFTAFLRRGLRELGSKESDIYLECQ